MSISGVGYHYFTKKTEEIIKDLKKAEIYALANTADSATRLFLENDYPKVLIVVYEHMVSAFPFSPQIGESMYSGWLNFNTRKNSYAQKYGSLLVMENNEICSQRLEFWKEGKEIYSCVLGNKLDITKDDAKEFMKLIYSALYPNETLEEGNMTQTNGDVNLELFEKALGIPLLFQEDCINRYKIVEETQFLKIVESI